MNEKLMNMEIINTEGFLTQDVPGRCPSCEHEMTWHNVIGYGLYPLGGHRNNMNPNKRLGLAYECPECFTKSIHHAEEDYIESVATWKIDIKEIQRHQKKECENGKRKD